MQRPACVPKKIAPRFQGTSTRCHRWDCSSRNRCLPGVVPSCVSRSNLVYSVWRLVPRQGDQVGPSLFPPTRKGLEVLAVFRQGHCPNPRVRAVIDRAVPFHRLRLGTAPPTRDPPTVARTSFSRAETAPSHEQRMAALVERIRTKEQSAAARTKG